MSSEGLYGLFGESDATPLAVLGNFEDSTVAGLRKAASHRQGSRIQIKVIPFESQQFAHS
jgi:hypothetical protein